MIKIGDLVTYTDTHWPSRAVRVPGGWWVADDPAPIIKKGATGIIVDAVLNSDESPDITCDARDAKHFIVLVNGQLRYSPPAWFDEKYKNYTKTGDP